MFSYEFVNGYSIINAKFTGFDAKLARMGNTDRCSTFCESSRHSASLRRRVGERGSRAGRDDRDEDCTFAGEPSRGRRGVHVAVRGGKYSASRGQAEQTKEAARTRRDDGERDAGEGI